jgi:regulator of protease activity HflC (stomatin/prohibitin superfamily)
MSRNFKFALALLVGLFISPMLGGCASTVQPGNVGILVSKVGDNRGVSKITVTTGLVFVGPMESLYQFPIYMQNKVWTSDKGEDAEKEESLTFNSVEGSQLHADVAIQYTFEAEKVPQIFQQLHKSPEQIRDVFLRGRVRDAINKHSSKMSAVACVGRDMQKLLDESMATLKAELDPMGIKVDLLTFPNGIRADQKIAAMINAVVEAEQRAKEQEQKVKEAVAKAQQEVALAEGEAKATLTRAKAQAEANRMVSGSITPQIIQIEKIKKWDGKTPTVLGGGSLVQVPLPN